MTIARDARPSAVARADARASAASLVAAIGRAGYRITGPRRLAAELVAGRDGHFTSADLIVDAERRHKAIGRATIFRTLDLLTSLGLVERVDLPDGNHAWVACETVHHHHAICTRCGRSLDVGDPGLDEILATIGARAGFDVTAHRLEVFGLCATCRAIGDP